MARRAGVTVKIEGLGGVLAELEQRGGNVKRELTGALREGGEVIAREARAKTSSTEVAEAIEVTTVETRGEKVRVAVHVGDKWAAALARWIEYGTQAHTIRARRRTALLYGDRYAGAVRHPGTAARPFMRPAFDERERAAQEAVRRRLARAVSK